MNIPTLPTLSPNEIILVKWTVLLALAWFAHFILRQRHARWRIILWRTVLCVGVLIPVLQMVPLSIYTIAYEPRVESPITALQHAQFHQPAPPVSDPDATISSAPSALESHQTPVETTRATRLTALPSLFIIWVLGVIIGLARLFYWALQLSLLRKRALPANEQVQNIASTIQNELGIRGLVRVRISDSANSPFLCGLFRPTIILPRALLDSISHDELAALLRHEVAHVRHRDLFWSVAWRLTSVAAWFHPLVWKIPSAHSLACEEEADRLATHHSESPEFYSRTLAELALRVFALPSVETKLTLNAASQIVKRIKALKRDFPAWSCRHSVASASLVLLLLAISAGGKFLPTHSQAAEQPSPGATKELAIVVHDDDGKALADATVEPYAFRVKGHDSASSYSFRPRRKHTTDSNGIARVSYPVEAVPNEKQLTDKISFIVSHPDFTTRTVEFSVDKERAPIRLERGATVEISGYFGPDRERITNIVPNMSGNPQADWTEKSPGVFLSHQIHPGGYMIQISGKSPAGDLIHSEAVPFNAVKGLRHRFALDLKQGIRLVGRLDDSVPRPVRHGRVVISVRPKEIAAYVIPEDGGKLHERYGYFSFWRSHRPIAEDGTFTFESIPPGEVDVLVHGEGFASKNGGQPMNRIDGKPTPGLVIGVPRSFPLRAPETQITVATEKTATLEVTAKTKSGQPIEGATIHVNPNVMRMQTGIFGYTDPSSEEPFRDIEPLPPIRYSSTTDQDGRTVLENVPIVTRDLMLEHPSYTVPIHLEYADRYVRFRLAPGETKKIDLTLEPKGASHLGTIK